jgi:transposase
MIRISLPLPERERLRYVFRFTSDRKLRDRSQIVLLVQRGRPHQDIARDLGVTPRTVHRWLNVYLERGLEGLRPQKAKGAAPKLTADLAPILWQWVIDGPVQPLLDRANWTYAELADHLLQGQGRPRAEVGHAGILPQARHSPLPPDLPLPARRPGQAGRRPRRPGGVKKKRRRASSSC